MLDFHRRGIEVTAANTCLGEMWTSQERLVRTNCTRALVDAAKRRRRFWVVESDRVNDQAKPLDHVFSGRSWSDRPTRTCCERRGAAFEKLASDVGELRALHHLVSQPALRFDGEPSNFSNRHRLSCIHAAARSPAHCLRKNALNRPSQPLSS